jgi:hypothetical protein
MTDNPAAEPVPDYTHKSITWGAASGEGDTQDQVCVEFTDVGDNVQIAGVGVSDGDIENMTLAQLRTFWDAHDATELIDDDATWELVTAAPTSELRVSLVVSFSVPMVERVRERAAQAGMSSFDLLQQWIVERLDAGD